MQMPRHSHLAYISKTPRANAVTILTEATARLLKSRASQIRSIKTAVPRFKHKCHHLSLLSKVQRSNHQTSISKWAHLPRRSCRICGCAKWDPKVPRLTRVEKIQLQRSKSSTMAWSPHLPTKSGNTLITTHPSKGLPTSIGTWRTNSTFFRLRSNKSSGSQRWIKISTFLESRCISNATGPALKISSNWWAMSRLINAQDHSLSEAPIRKWRQPHHLSTQLKAAIAIPSRSKDTSRVRTLTTESTRWTNHFTPMKAISKTKPKRDNLCILKLLMLVQENWVLEFNTVLAHSCLSTCTPSRRPATILTILTLKYTNIRHHSLRVRLPNPLIKRQDRQLISFHSKFSKALIQCPNLSWSQIRSWSAQAMMWVRLKVWIRVFLSIRCTIRTRSQMGAEKCATSTIIHSRVPIVSNSPRTKSSWQPWLNKRV